MASSWGQFMQNSNTVSQYIPVYEMGYFHSSITKNDSASHIKQENKQISKVRVKLFKNSTKQLIKMLAIKR